MALELVVIGISLAALSGFPGLIYHQRPALGQRVAAVLMLGSLGFGLAGCGVSWFQSPGSANTEELLFPWMALAPPFIGLDPLSVFFLVPIFLIGGLGSWYGLGYWSAQEHPSSTPRLGGFWGLMIAGMALLVVSRQGLGFLLGWEAMAVSAFFLISTEDNKRETRHAALVFLIATHVGTLALFGWLALWRNLTGSFDLVPLAVGQGSAAEVNLLFFLALLAFGLKAGIVPLHFWLPGAHASAPTHVSAVLSGVVLKMGIYGLVRVLWLLPAPPTFWGVVLVLLGTASAVLGVTFALAQHDVKRLLAYHSVENIGIIVMGLGMAVVGRTTHNPGLQILGMAGALLHVWNHALFKSLLFFGAGSVIRAAGTQDIDQLGGWARNLRWTALLFLIGSAAIVGLPPLNGFVSEWLIYVGFFRSVTLDGPAALALGAPFLAVVGALALACFVKVYGVVFLGQSRTLGATRSTESWSMVIPAGFLGVVCLAIGLAPSVVAPVLDRVASMGTSTGALPPVASLAALDAIQPAVLGLTLALGVATVIVMTVRRRAPRRATWDCGYAEPTPRMQYTASSVAQSIGLLMRWVLRPKDSPSRMTQTFARPMAWHSRVTEFVLDRVLRPLNRRLEALARWIRPLQQGLTQHYLAYILGILLILLAVLIPYRDLVHWLGIL